MRVLYVKPYPGELDIAREALPECTLIPTDSIDAVEGFTAESIDALCVFVDTTVDKEVIERFPKLSAIITRSTGFDHIDTAHANERGIAVSNVPRYGSQTVAEYAFALMFALSRNAFHAYTDMLRRTIITDLERYEGFDLSKKVLGVVGTGAIGAHVCKIAGGLDMEVRAFDKYPNEKIAALPHVSYVDLPELLRTSDIVTLHVPSNPETHHLMDAKMLALMKESAYLINTARGEVIDTPALVRALRTKKLAGAALDVLEGERELHDEAELLDGEDRDAQRWRVLVADYMLVDMPNVIVTPHIAFNTREAKREILDTTIANIRACASGEPQNRVPV